jgi:hypothetical protein
MTINAAACTILLIFACNLRTSVTPPPENARPVYWPGIRKTFALGVLGTLLVCVTGWAAKRAAWGDKPAGIVNTDQIRFGPNNTNTIR